MKLLKILYDLLIVIDNDKVIATSSIDGVATGDLNGLSKNKLKLLYNRVKINGERLELPESEYLYITNQ